MDISRNIDGYYNINNNPDTVAAFQNMLRLVSLAERNLPVIGVDGVYGRGMEEAVRQYQAQKRIPVTGRVDFITWNAVAADYNRLLRTTSPPIMISPFPNLRGYKIRRGERSDLVTILQLMLSALRLRYEGIGSIPVTGTYDARTTRAVKHFQLKNLIPEDDFVDKATWDSLARQYNIDVNKTQ